MTTDVANEVQLIRNTGERKKPVVSQIIYASQIHEGRRYEMICVAPDVPEHLKRRQFEVVKLPYQKDNGAWRMDIRYVGKGVRDTHIVYPISLRDYQLFPYEEGDWNQSNYIREAEGSSD